MASQCFCYKGADHRWYYSAGSYEYWLYYGKYDRSVVEFKIAITLLALEAYELVGLCHG